MKNKLDYYTVLSLNRNASAAAIKKRFRELAKQYHPDTSGDHDTTEDFKRITEAYEVLSDSEKRRAYDAKLDAEARANAPRPAFIVCPQNARDYIEKVQARVDREPDGVNRSPTAKMLSRPVNYRMILARWGDFLVFAAAAIAVVVSISSIKANSDHYRADFQQYQTSHALSVDEVLFTRMVTLAQSKDIATFELSVQQYSSVTHRMLDNQTNYDCVERGFAENRDMNAHCILDLTGNISDISNANQLNKDAVNQDTSTIDGTSIALLIALFIAIVKILWNIGQTGTRKLINMNYQERLSYWQQLYCCKKDYIIFLPGKPEALIPLKEAYLDMLTGKEYATIKDVHAPNAFQVIRVFALCFVALLIVDFLMTASLGGLFSHNLAQFTVPNVPVVKPSKATIHISGLCQGTVIDNSGSNDILTSRFELQLNQSENNLYGPFHIDGAAYGVVQVFSYYGGSGSFTGTLDAMGNIEGALSDGGGYERYLLMAIANNSGSFSGTIPDSGWGVVTFSAHCSK